MKKLKGMVEEQIALLTEAGITANNLDAIYKLVDIHKDIENEMYWKTEKEDMSMRYRENYGRRSRDSRGRYRHGIEETIEEMQEMLQEYHAGRNEYSRGNYRAKEDTIKSLEYMLESVVDFIGMLQEEAGSQEEVELIKKYVKKLSEM